MSYIRINPSFYSLKNNDYRSRHKRILEFKRKYPFVSGVAIAMFTCEKDSESETITSVHRDIDSAISSFGLDRYTSNELKIKGFYTVEMKGINEVSRNYETDSILLSKVTGPANFGRKYIQYFDENGIIQFKFIDEDYPRVRNISDLIFKFEVEFI